MDIIINNKVTLNENEIIYDNEGYKLVYNRVTEIITEYQDEELQGDTKQIENVNDVEEIKEGFYADWRYVDFEAGQEEEEFFNEIKKLY